jgi:hypothetical protein
MRGVTRGNELTNRLTLPPSRTLVTPTTSTPLVRDNTSRVFLLVFHLASTHLDKGTQRQIYSSVQRPPGPKRRQIPHNLYTYKDVIVHFKEHKMQDPINKCGTPFTV